jgi:hypothetical protein
VDNRFAPQGEQKQKKPRGFPRGFRLSEIVEEADFSGAPSFRKPEDHFSR